MILPARKLASLKRRIPNLLHHKIIPTPLNPRTTSTPLRALHNLHMKHTSRGVRRRWNQDVFDLAVPKSGENADCGVEGGGEIYDYVWRAAAGGDGDFVVEEVGGAVVAADAHDVFPETAGCHGKGFGGVVWGRAC